MPEKTTKLINRKTGELQCKLCGELFFAANHPISGEDYYSGDYRCPHCSNENSDISGKPIPPIEIQQSGRAQEPSR